MHRRPSEVIMALIAADAFLFAVAGRCARRLRTRRDNPRLLRVVFPVIENELKGCGRLLGLFSHVSSSSGFEHPVGSKVFICREIYSITELGSPIGGGIGNSTHRVPYFRRHW